MDQDITQSEQNQYDDPLPVNANSVTKNSKGGKKVPSANKHSYYTGEVKVDQSNLVSRNGSIKLDTSTNYNMLDMN